VVKTVQARVSDSTGQVVASLSIKP
jgi:hypothetical protein